MSITNYLPYFDSWFDGKGQTYSCFIQPTRRRLPATHQLPVPLGHTCRNDDACLVPWQETEQANSAISSAHQTRDQKALTNAIYKLMQLMSCARHAPEFDTCPRKHRLWAARLAKMVLSLDGLRDVAQFDDAVFKTAWKRKAEEIDDCEFERRMRRSSTRKLLKTRRTSAARSMTSDSQAPETKTVAGQEFDTIILASSNSDASTTQPSSLARTSTAHNITSSSKAREVPQVQRCELDADFPPSWSDVSATQGSSPGGESRSSSFSSSTSWTSLPSTVDLDSRAAYKSFRETNWSSDAASTAVTDVEPQRNNRQPSNVNEPRRSREPSNSHEPGKTSEQSNTTEPTNTTEPQATPSLVETAQPAWPCIWCQDSNASCTWTQDGQCPEFWAVLNPASSSWSCVWCFDLNASCTFARDGGCCPAAPHDDALDTSLGLCV